jgi:hypothetical protein
MLSGGRCGDSLLAGFQPLQLKMGNQALGNEHLNQDGQVLMEGCANPPLPTRRRLTRQTVGRRCLPSSRFKVISTLC